MKVAAIFPSYTECAKALKDFLGAFKFWRIFCLIGVNEIQKRYSRSKLGQFWLTASLAINITVLSLVWSYLFKIPIKTYVPYITLGMIIWTYISTCVTEGCQLYISYTSYIKELGLPKLSYCNSLFVRNITVMLHNLPVFMVIALAFQMPISLKGVVLFLAGFAITSVFLYAVVVTLSLIGLRFRDVSNIVASLMQVAIYVTPVLWKMESMPEHVRKYLLLNPFVIFISICRDPLFNEPVPMLYWILAAAYSGAALLIAVWIFAKLRARIAYWL